MTEDVARPRSLREVVDRVEVVSSEREVSLGDLVAAFGNTSFVPALTIPALIVVSPLSGIPGLSSLCGISIALVAVQMTFRRRHLWVPEFIASRKVSGARIRSATSRIHRLVGWIDGHSRPRFRYLLREPVATISHSAAACCGLAMPILEFVPFTSSILGAAVLLFAIGFLARDGLWILAAALFLTSGVILAGTVVF